MTGMLPYHGHNFTTRAILNGESPSDISDSDMPACVRTVLTQCWQQDPNVRPSSTQCLGELIRFTWSEFHGVEELPCSKMLVGTVAQGDGWEAIHNPKSRDIYKVTLMSTSASWSRYVPWDLIPVRIMIRC